MTLKDSIPAKLSAADLSVLLGVSIHCFYKAARSKNTFPKKDAAGNYIVREVCEWILSPENTTRRSKLWDGSNRIMSKMKRAAEPTDKATTKSSKKKPAAKKRKAPLEKPSSTPQPVTIDPLPLPDDNFSDILDKFRAAVNHCADKWRKAMDDKDDALASALMRNWGMAFDTLRKSEESVLDIHKRRGSMLPKEDVVAAFVSMANNIRSRVMILPAKLSHELLGKSTAGSIQEVLESELRDCLDDLARNPFGADGKT